MFFLQNTVLLEKYDCIYKTDMYKLFMLVHYIVLQIFYRGNMQRKPQNTTNIFRIFPVCTQMRELKGEIYVDFNGCIY